MFSFATTSTLEMYSESSIAKPLSLAGGYAGEAAHKRQLETVRFWIDVSEPGGLDPCSRRRAAAPPRCASASCTCSFAAG